MERSHRYFLKVARCGSVSRASEELNVAQPSLTRMISKLESELGVALFVRLPRGMALTDAGKTLFKHLQEIDASYDRALKDIAAHEEGYHDRIRIGVGLTYQIALMPQLLDAITREFPNTSYTIVSGSAMSIARQLTNEELDIGISASDRFSDHPGLKAELLGSIEHGVAHLPGTLSGVEPDQVVPLASLIDKEWITFLLDSNMGESFNELFFHHKLPMPRVVLNTNSLELGLTVQRQRGALMAVPTMLQPNLKAHGVHLNRTEEPLWRYPSGIAILRANQNRPTIRRVVELVVTLATEMGWGDQRR